MGLAKRIIPCLDCDKGRVVKGVKFLDIRDAGDPVEVSKRYCDAGSTKGEKLDTFNDSTFITIEAGNYALCESHYTLLLKCY
jgi:hypothetical protein